MNIIFTHESNCKKTHNTRARAHSWNVWLKHNRANALYLDNIDLYLKNTTNLKHSMEL